MPAARSFPRPALAALAVLGLSLALTGCSDLVTYAQQHRELGIAAYNHEDYPKASGAFRQALKQDPRDYLSHYYLGLSSLQLHNYQQAMVAFRSCLETQGVTYAGQEDNDTRIKALDGLAQAIVKADTSDVEVNKIEQAARAAQGAKAAREFFVLAKIYRYRMLPDMALDYYNRAVIDDPKNFAYVKEFGLYCEQLQQTARAREALRQAYAIDSTDKDVIQALQRVGIVPGPALKAKNDLVPPPVPKGPIPQIDMSQTRPSGGDSSLSVPLTARYAASDATRPPAAVSAASVVITATHAEKSRLPWLPVQSPSEASQPKRCSHANATGAAKRPIQIRVSTRRVTATGRSA